MFFIEIALSIYALRLCRAFTPLKASQKYSVGCEKFGLRRKPIYEIDPRTQSYQQKSQKIPQNSENSSFFSSKKASNGFQIDLIIDRKDATINLCECKFYESNFKITKKYAEEIKLRKASFIDETQTKKMVLNIFIANETLIENEHSLDIVDSFIHIKDLM